MILQPLVENAIKHGIGPRAEGGSIRIESARSNGDLLITVRDNGLGFPAVNGEHREGVGLSNTRRRLKHLYGERHSFDLTQPANEGVEIKLRIPYTAV
jgi:two-component system LytT family sensor kinase